MYINSLYLEVTRRCNMSCGHCLRGCAQNVDLDPDVVEKFLRLNNIDAIGTIGFSGGEPSLNSALIRKAVEIFDKIGILVDGFDITTNGRQASKEFFLAMGELYAFISCHDEESAFLSISRSYWHAEQGQDERWVEMLKVFKFAQERRYIDYSDGSLISEGRAIRNTYASRRVDKTAKIEVEIGPRDYVSTTDSTVYINALGQICADCDFSYATQKKVALGLAAKDRLIDIAKACGTLTQVD